MQTSKKLLVTFLAAVVVFLHGPVRAADSPQTNSVPADKADLQQALAASLQLQEKLHGTILAIEQSRAEAAAAAKTNADAIASRLELLEKSISRQRDDEMRAAQSSTRAMLMASGLFASVGVLALLVTTWFQLRGMNRLAEIASATSGMRTLGSGPNPALLGGGASGQFGPDPASLRLMEALERMEKRIHELEHTAAAPLAEGNGQRPARTPVVETVEVTELDGAASNGVHQESPGAEDKLATLLGKGKALLNLGQADRALGCFNAILAEDPRNAEALFRRGSALERLKRPEEALASYDQALEIDPFHTQAHLAKGGVYNQLERFSEALDCFEQAIKTQQRSAA
jgi:tetratricopeptide (TPR) repeat protein